MSSRDEVPGIQLKTLNLLVFFIIFLDPVVKPRDDTLLKLTPIR
ncbi:MAG TPA: palindromic element RPE4 domain-containing protein [Rickettsia endosymbiont of Omalisus fontisbellaquei]|nr:palindromic element RPE4 domain-containing protein [Rickettsia endosymbiont of Omalisus fontisbellaquei]